MDINSTYKLGILLRSYDALHNWRALLLLIASCVIAGLIVTAGISGGGSNHSAALFIALFLVAMLVLAIGVNAAGLALVDQADGQAFRGFVPATFGGVGATVRVVGALLLLGLGFAVLLAILYVISRLGQIPHLQAVFGFLLAGPSVVVLALAYAVLLLGVPLIFVVIWQGEGLVHAILRAIDIVVSRPLTVFIHFVVLWVIVFPAAAFVFWLTIFASIPVDGMYLSQSSGLASGLGSWFTAQNGLGSLGGPLSLLREFGVGLGGASLSITIISLLAGAVVVLIYMLGLIYLFRSVSEGVGSEVSDMLRTKMADFKQKTEQRRARSSEAPVVPRAPPTTTPTISSSATPNQMAFCPQCRQTIAANDVFCGACGFALKQT